MTKCSRQTLDYDTIASINDESSNVCVCGILKSLSPLKISRSNTDYFDGELADSTGKIRAFGFNAPMHKKLQQLHVAKWPILLTGCNITLNANSSSLEVKLLGQTKLSEADIEMSFEDSTDNDVKITQIREMADYEKVKVQAKVITTLDPVKVSVNNTKQDVVIGDETGSMKLTLWNKDVNTLQDGESFLIENIQIRSFRNQKFLSSTRDGMKITSISDIGAVQNESADFEYGTIKKGRIVGVSEIIKLKTCVKCTKRIIINDSDDKFITCTTCKTLQIVEDNNQKNMITELVVRDEDYNVNYIL